jgi:hypothetical protein
MVPVGAGLVDGFARSRNSIGGEWLGLSVSIAAYDRSPEPLCRDFRLLKRRKINATD